VSVTGCPSIDAGGDTVSVIVLDVCVPTLSTTDEDTLPLNAPESGAYVATST
jgi:hypothetical protein